MMGNSLKVFYPFMSYNDNKKIRIIFIACNDFGGLMHGVVMVTVYYSNEMIKVC